MGLLDALKGLLPKGEAFPWDPESVRHPKFTLRLPEGWRFTRADWGRATAAGPAGQAAELYYSTRGSNAAATPEKMLELMRGLVRHDARFKTSPTQSILPNGVLWTEASETQGANQHFVVYLARLLPALMIQVCLRTAVPATSGALGAERLEMLRGALRSVEWH